MLRESGYEDVPLPVQALIRQKVGRDLDSISVQMVLGETYDTQYGIYDHNVMSRDRPLAAVGMHIRENTTENSRLHALVVQYANDKVGDIFKLSLVEYLNLPREMVDLIRRICLARKSHEMPAIEKAVKEMTG